MDMFRVLEPLAVPVVSFEDAIQRMIRGESYTLPGTDSNCKFKI
jgi:hypothetical protein